MTELSSSDQKHAASGRLKRSDTRVDAPHGLRAPGRDANPDRHRDEVPVDLSVAAAEPSVAAAEPVNSAAAFVAHVQTQAAQLAEHLQRQRDNLDRREAELNARLAAVDNQVRGARLWLEQREAEMEARAAELRGQQQAIEDHLAQLGLTIKDATIADIRGELTRQTELLNGRAREADDRQRALAQQEAELARRATQLDVKQKYFDKTEQLLADEREGLASVRKELELERAELDQQRHQQVQQLREAEARSDAQRLKQGRELGQRSAALEKREAALERLHNELMHSQREVLEVRLATEEIWSELSGMMSPAALTQSIAQVRSKLAEQFSLTKAELVEREALVRQLATELTAEHDRLEQQKTKLHQWVACRQEELQQQKARVVAADRQHDRQRIQDREASLQWHEERLEYQREIRRLVTRLHEIQPAAA